jgi:hypothetical protein
VVYIYKYYWSTRWVRYSLTLLPFNMTLISNDPSWWPSIEAYRVQSYFARSWSIASWC